MFPYLSGLFKSDTYWWRYKIEEQNLKKIRKCPIFVFWSENALILEKENTL